MTCLRHVSSKYGTPISTATMTKKKEEEAEDPIHSRIMRKVGQLLSNLDINMHLKKLNHRFVCAYTLLRYSHLVRRAIKFLFDYRLLLCGVYKKEKIDSRTEMIEERKKAKKQSWKSEAWL